MRTALAILTAAAVATACTVTTILPFGAGPTAGTASQIVGAGGGLVATTDGTTLLIPPNALASDVTITIGLDPAAPLPTQAQALAPAHVFGPEGVTFAVPVCVTLSYEPPQVPDEGAQVNVSVYQELPDAGGFLAVPTVAASATQVTGMTTTLSTMVVGFGAARELDASPDGESCDASVLEAGATGD